MSPARVSAGGEVDHDLPVRVEERRRQDQEGFGPAGCGGVERALEMGRTPPGEPLHAKRERPRRQFDLGVGDPTAARVPRKPHSQEGSGSFRQQPESLRREDLVLEGQTGQVASGLPEAVDQPRFDRIGDDRHDDSDRPRTPAPATGLERVEERTGEGRRTIAQEYDPRSGCAGYPLGDRRGESGGRGPGPGGSVAGARDDSPARMCAEMRGSSRSSGFPRPTGAPARGGTGAASRSCVRSVACPRGPRLPLPGPGP